MVEQGVPHPGHGALAGLGQVHAGRVVGEPGNGGKHQAGGRAQHNVPAQHLPPAQRFDPLHQKAGQVEGGVVDDRVHRDPDDLGRHVVCHHGDDHHDHRQQELSPKALGKGEEPQDIGCFGGWLLHNTPHTG